MSLAERIRGRRSGRLLLVLGADTLWCGLCLGRGRGVIWPDAWRQEVRLHDEGPGARPPMETLLSALARLERGLSALPDQPGVREVRVLISDVWLPGVGVPWSDELQDAVRTRPYVLAQFRDAGCDVPAEALIKIDDAPFETPRFVVAYPEVLISTLHQFANHFRARFASMLPLSAAAATVMSFDQTHSWFAIQDGSVVLMVRGEGRRRISDVAIRYAWGSLDNAIRQEWQRWKLRGAMSAGGPLRILNMSAVASDVDQGDAEVAPLRSLLRDAAVPRALELCHAVSSVKHPLDAISTRWHGPKWAIAVGLCAMVFMSMVLFQAWSSAKQVKELELLVADKVSRPAPVRASQDLRRDELARIRPVNMAIRSLNLPITPVLKALVPPKDMQVALLSIETASGDLALQGAHGKVKVSAGAASTSDMTSYITFLGQRHPLVGAVLIRHETTDAGVEHPVRFIVEARWSQ